MRVANAKSKLEKVLQKEVSVRNVKKQISTVVIDGSAIFYVIPWPPSSATVEDFVISFRNYIEKRLQSSDAYLVFDRYKEYSKKRCNWSIPWCPHMLRASAYHCYAHTIAEGYPNHS